MGVSTHASPGLGHQLAGSPESKISSFSLVGAGPRQDTREAMSQSRYLHRGWESFKRLLLGQSLPLLVLAMAYVATNFYLTFFGSEFHKYLGSDMAGYWGRAERIYGGDPLSRDNWVANAPYLPRLLAEFFGWLDFFHLGQDKLQALMIAHIVLATLKLLALFDLGLLMFRQNRWVAFLFSAFYSFAYPNIYFTVFVMGEPVGVPLFIIAIWIMFRFRSPAGAFWSGIILGIGVGARPSNSLLALPFGLWNVLDGTKGIRPRELFQQLKAGGFLRGGFFSLGYLMIVGSIIIENYHVSKGELRGMTAHAGYNFLLAQSSAHALTAKDQFGEYTYVPGSTAPNPENGWIHSNIPVHRSDLYFREGWKILKARPDVWWNHVKDLRFLFFENMFPDNGLIFGYQTFFDAFRWVGFYSVVFSPLALVVARRGAARMVDVMFFGGILVLSVAALFLFPKNYQYFLNFNYAPMILAFIAFWGLFTAGKDYRYLFFIFTAVVLVFHADFLFYKKFTKLKMLEPKFDVVIEESNEPLYQLSRPYTVKRSKHIAVDTLNFTQSLDLIHGTIGKLGFEDDFAMKLTTEFDVLETSVYMFNIYSDDGFAVTLNEQPLIGFENWKKIREEPFRVFKELKAGHYVMKIRFFEAGVYSALIGFYRPIDPKNDRLIVPYEYDTKWGQGNLLGVDDEVTKFHFPSLENRKWEYPEKRESAEKRAPKEEGSTTAKDSGETSSSQL